MNPATSDTSEGTSPRPTKGMFKTCLAVLGVAALLLVGSCLALRAYMKHKYPDGMEFMGSHRIAVGDEARQAISELYSDSPLASAAFADPYYAVFGYGSDWAEYAAFSGGVNDCWSVAEWFAEAKRSEFQDWDAFAREEHGKWCPSEKEDSCYAPTLWDLQGVAEGKFIFKDDRRIWTFVLVDTKAGRVFLFESKY